MGDWFQTVVDRDATQSEAPQLGAAIHQWLVSEGIVEAEASDCVLCKCMVAHSSMNSLIFRAAALWRLLDSKWLIARERPKVERLLNTVCQLPFDAAAAAKAARIRGMLEALGQPIGPYDTLLAGQALSLGLILVTDNTAEFTRVARLSLENWQAPPPPWFPCMRLKL